VTIAKLSGFVVSYNRAELIGTCLRSLRFADELIVIDKSSTDATPDVARLYADRVITVPWTPTVEATRALALEACQHEWIAFLDDDEMFSPAAITYLRTAREADAVALPRRHWILGAFDTDAYYWPEHQVRLFRRGAVAFGPVVHGGVALHSDRVEQVSADSQIYIEHLSHTDTEQWIERTNRYTSQPLRVSSTMEEADLIEFAHRRIDHWISSGARRDGYPAAVALLRAIYDMVDRLKAWEAARGVDGAQAFRMRCAELERSYDELETRLGIPTGMRA